MSASPAVSPSKGEAVRDEIADILYYLVRLADILELDLEQCVWEKMRKNEKKYPAERSRGSARKYTEYE